MKEQSQTNTKYKDGIFRMLFSTKEELLSLYNATSRTNYTDESLLEIRTLRDATYLSIKNDISFIIDRQLSIYEHQSTWNGNMPFRNLQYVTDLFAGLLSDKNIYGTKTLELPHPHFVTFYNGTRKVPDRVVQKLSDAYGLETDDVNLELKVIVLNINQGHNQKLMSECKTLREYAYYVDTVREYLKEFPIEVAVEKAIIKCIENDVLADFLRTHRAEVKHVSIYEYDAEKHIAMEKAESRDEGRVEGDTLRLVSQIRSKIQKSKSLETIADELECEVEEIRHIYDMIVECGIECSVEEIMEKLRV